MDESWRMRMGNPARRSIGNSSENLLTDDFSDVFGGPPRTIHLRNFSADFTHSTSFYDEIFHPSESGCPARSKSGRNLTAFKIPARSDGFYSDVFGNSEGCERGFRSGSGSKSKTDSSSEEMNPFRAVGGDRAGLSPFASKLRPLNVPSRWNSSKVGCSEHQKNYGMPILTNKYYSFDDNHFRDNEYNENPRSIYYGYSGPMVSPEAISIDHNSYGCIKMSTDDLKMNSPSSVVSSLCINSGAKSVMHNLLPEDDVNDDVSSSVVIEISPNLRATSSEAVSVEESIAWDKEKFQMQNSSELCTKEYEKQHPTEIDG